MRRRLVERFGDDIIISQRGNLTGVVTFKATYESILHDYHKVRREEGDAEEEKAKLLKTAAKLIQSGIRSLECTRDDYQASSTITLESNLYYMPQSLRDFLNVLFQNNASDLKKQTKHTPIKQAIVQATRPRVLLAPIQIDLGIQMHHVFGSQFLVDTLHRLGLSCSFDEVLSYQTNAALAQSSGMSGPIGGPFGLYISS